MFKVASDLSGAAASTPQGYGGTAPASAHGDSVAAVEPLCIGKRVWKRETSVDVIMVR